MGTVTDMAQWRRTRPHKWVRPEDGMRIELIHISASPRTRGASPDSRQIPAPANGWQLRLTTRHGFLEGYLPARPDLLDDLAASGWEVTQFPPRVRTLPRGVTSETR